MKTKQQIRELIHRAEKLQRPVCSMYISVPLQPGDAIHTARTRVHNTCLALEVPKDISARIETYIRRQEVQGCTIVVFATQDDFVAETLPMTLPVIDATTGRYLARFGALELLPLYYALAECPTLGAIYCDREQCRLFSLELGRIEELREMRRPESDVEFQGMKASKQEYPSAIFASRGGAAKDLAQDYLDELTERFYREIAAAAAALWAPASGNREPGSSTPELEAEHRLEGLMIFAPEGTGERLRDAMPPALRDRCILLSGLSSPNAPSSEIQERTVEIMDELRHKRHTELLERAMETGVAGAASSLQAAQEGRVQTLLVPWPVDAMVYEDRTQHYAAVSREEADAISDAPPVPVPLSDVVVRLHHDFSTELAFLQGSERETLISKLDGLAAITRW